MAAYLENLEQVAAHLLQRLQREAFLAGPESESERRYRELSVFYPDINTAQSGGFHGHAPVMSTIFVKDGLRMSLFSTITTLGTPCDITLQELRIESMFPADPASDQLLRMLTQKPL